MKGTVTYALDRTGVAIHDIVETKTFRLRKTERADFQTNTLKLTSMMFEFCWRRGIHRIIKWEIEA